MGKKLALEDRLLKKVVINQLTNCWEWTGGKNNIGYGMIRDGDRMRTTHRVSYEVHNKQSIPKYLCVCHSCDNPICINPNHLWLGTRAQNTQDMLNKGRRNWTTSGWVKGQPRPKIKCKYCSAEMAASNLYRWHNENCKKKP